MDRQKAAELTNALRDRGVILDRVKSRRDESEPLIRLADMWAGCIRAANLGGGDEKEILDRALDLRRIWALHPLPKKRKNPVNGVLLASRLFSLAEDQSLPNGQAFTETRTFILCHWKKQVNRATRVVVTTSKAADAKRTRPPFYRGFSAPGDWRGPGQRG